MQKNKIKERIFLGMLLFILWSGLAGCGAEEGISLEEMTGEMQTEQEQDEHKAGNAKEAKERNKDAGGKEVEERAQTANGSETDPAAGMLSVYVCGAVHAPGVYELPAGSRLYQAIDAAGGMREDADKNYLNLAMELADGEKLQVPTVEEVQTGVFAERTETMEQASGKGDSGSKGGGPGLVNINTADETLLMTLPGIGEAKAKSIIAYRMDKGSFAKIEDIMNISGIKQAAYDKIKDKICVN